MTVLQKLSLVVSIVSLSVTISFANDCATAIPITSEENVFDSQISGSFIGAGFSGVAQCTGPGGQDDVWFSFVAVAEDHFVRARGPVGIDIAIEVYDGCAGTLLNCRNNNGLGASENAILSGLTPGNTYFFRIFHAGGAAATTDDYLAGVAHVPFVELNAISCGATDLTTNDRIRATVPSNTFNFTNYQFRFEELEAPFNTYTVTSPNGTNPNFLLQWFPELEYGRSYDVSVRVRAILPTYGDFGNTCTITMQSDVLSPELEPQYVNGFFSFCNTIGATKVGLATQYSWTFLNLDDLSSSQVFGLADSRLLNLSRVPNLQLGTTYAVGVIATVAGQNSPAGPLRFLNMNNAVPNTSINDDLYPCGQTYSIGTFLQAREICNAEAYTWRFTNTTSAQAPILFTRNDGSRFVSLNDVAGLNVGDSYDVEVLGEQGGLIGDYSTICNITIGAPFNAVAGLVGVDSKFRTGDARDVEEVFYESKMEWSIDIIPAELSGDMYSISFTSADPSETALLEVFDLSGRKVGNMPSSTLSAGAVQTIDLNGLPAGIYVAVVSNSTQRESFKISTF